MPTIGSAHIRRRTTSKGEARFQVRYRLGGRGAALRHGGTYRRLSDAKEREAFLRTEMAAGRDPEDALRVLGMSQERMSLEKWGERYLSTRVDLSTGSLANQRCSLARIYEHLGERDPHSLTHADVQGWVTAVGQGERALTPVTVRNYLKDLRVLLDFVGLDPNPARDRRVRLPKVKRTVIEPPTASEFAAILSAVPEYANLPLRVLEATGMRVGELEALEWRDVDYRTSRFRLRDGKTDAARRWVGVPRELMEELSVAPGTGRVFPQLNRGTLAYVMRTACDDLGMRRISPHKLRHRDASVRIARGENPVEVARHLGHSRPSITLDTYSHVLVSDSGDAPVMPRESGSH